MERLNNYPFVMCHGFAGFGEDELLFKLIPYYGMTSTNIKKLYAEYGTEFYTPSLSGFASAWDRGCELYAQIVGGTVDYGKVHSEKYGHKRFGRTYKGMVPEWGKTDDEGNIRKINLGGHSFGCNTIRFFVDMMVRGSEEEKKGTPKEELSDFFKGGHKNWIHSCICFAGANDGVGFLYAAEPAVPIIAKAAIYGISILGHTPIAKLYDPMMEHFGISDNPWKRTEKFKLKKAECDAYLASGDCVLNDLYVHTVRERTKDWKTFNNIYYFAYSACKTVEDSQGNQVPVKSMIAPMKITSRIIGRYNGNPADEKHSEIGPEWKRNDGICNTVVSQAPKNEKWEPWHGENDIKPGIWYDMPVEYKDHMSYTGLGESRGKYAIFFYEILKRISNLPSIDL